MSQPLCVNAFLWFALLPSWFVYCECSKLGLGTVKHTMLGTTWRMWPRAHLTCGLEQFISVLGQTLPEVCQWREIEHSDIICVPVTWAKHGIQRLPVIYSRSGLFAANLGREEHTNSQIWQNEWLWQATSLHILWRIAFWWCTCTREHSLGAQCKCRPAGEWVG